MGGRSAKDCLGISHQKAHGVRKRLPDLRLYYSAEQLQVINYWAFCTQQEPSLMVDRKSMDLERYVW